MINSWLRLKIVIFMVFFCDFLISFREFWFFLWLFLMFCCFDFSNFLLRFFVIFSIVFQVSCWQMILSYKRVFMYMILILALFVGIMFVYTWKLGEYVEVRYIYCKDQMGIKVLFLGFLFQLGWWSTVELHWVDQLHWVDRQKTWVMKI